MQIIEDRSRRLTPYWRDQAVVRSRLLRLFPRHAASHGLVDDALHLPLHLRQGPSEETAWLRPPPAAPPLIPNTGPRLGSRMNVTVAPHIGAAVLVGPRRDRDIHAGGACRNERTFAGDVIDDTLPSRPRDSFAITSSPDLPYEYIRNRGRSSDLGTDADPGIILESIDGTLERLGLDFVEIMYGLMRLGAVLGCLWSADVCAEEPASATYRSVPPPNDRIHEYVERDVRVTTAVPSAQEAQDLPPRRLADRQGDDDHHQDGTERHTGGRRPRRAPSQRACHFHVAPRIAHAGHPRRRARGQTAAPKHGSNTVGHGIQSSHDRQWRENRR